jgi:hypothetical protein
VLQTFDTISETYGIEFPAADFFYPDFTEDLIANSERLEMAGIKTIEGKPCAHLIASGRGMNVQIWVSTDSLRLPKKVVVNYYEGKLVKRYEGDFSSWTLGPRLPAAMFEFTAPPGARSLYMLPAKNSVK